MTQASSHTESQERALQVLRDQIGPRWSGREGAGRAEMARVLQAALGYDKRQANTVIDSLIHIDRLHYHPGLFLPDASPGNGGASGGSLHRIVKRSEGKVSLVGRVGTWSAFRHAVYLTASSARSSLMLRAPCQPAIPSFITALRRTNPEPTSAL